MIILGIETSTFAGSVALVEKDRLIAEYSFNLGPKHNEKLIPSIEMLLEDACISKKDIEGVAVSKGPGSFTSLRVGVSTAKALSYSLGIKLVGISSLEILAYGIFGNQVQICPVIDARKKQIFYAFYKNYNQFEVLKEGTIISPEQLCDNISEETIFLGNGSLIYKDLFIERLGDKAKFVNSIFNIGRASICGVLGRSKIINNLDESCFNLLPQYLRKSEAELKK